MSDYVNFRQKLLEGLAPAGGVEAMPTERIVSSLDKAMGELQKLQRLRKWEQAEAGAVELSLGDEAVTHRERDVPWGQARETAMAKPSCGGRDVAQAIPCGTLATEAATHLESERIEFEKQSQFPVVSMDVTSSTDMDYKNTTRSGLRENKPNPGLRPEALNSKS
jgi:hypothetical protein